MYGILTDRYTFFFLEQVRLLPTLEIYKPSKSHVVYKNLPGAYK